MQFRYFLHRRVYHSIPIVNSLTDRLFRIAPAQQLSDILDAASRTTSLIESINGLLKQFLHNRRSFPDTDSLQNYLNLFVLWHNMRVYQRGKRQGQSPYQRAGIPLPSSDWLDLLGFPRV